MHKSGELLEGSAFGEKKTAVYKRAAQGDDAEIVFTRLVLKNGEGAVEITNGEWPNLAIRGSLESEDGSIRLSHARFLSSHVQGWNDITLELLGSAVFQASGGIVGTLYINGEVEMVQVSSGKIRLKSDRLSGDAALVPLRNRRERILALIEWMDEEAPENRHSFAGQKDFELFWKPLLFPELVSKRRRPHAYFAKNAEWKRADSVKWNTSYTETLFPEELRELRNSGALLRDWEEALPWIYMEYSWKNIINSLNGINLLKS